MPRPERHPKIIAAWFQMVSAERIGSSNTRFKNTVAFSTCAIAVIGDGSAYECTGCGYMQMYPSDRGQEGKLGF